MKQKELKILYTVMYKNDSKEWIKEPAFRPAVKYQHAIMDLNRAKDAWPMYKWKLQRWVKK